MDTKVKIPFAEHNGKIVHISQVENGLSCNCLCCYCGAKLIAKNNSDNIREPHFAHYDSDDCGKSLETSIHKAAKQYLSENKRIILPDLFYYDKSNLIDFESVELEKTINYEGSSIKVDALCYTHNDHKIIVEFAVSHYTGEKKKQILSKLKIPTIEVSLPLACISFEGIKTILEESGFKEWLYYPIMDSPKLKSIINEYKKELKICKNKLLDLERDNDYHKSEISNLEELRLSQNNGKVINGFIGIGWGQKLDKPIHLSINEADLNDVILDKYRNYRLIIFNRKEEDSKRNSNLVVFIDKRHFNKNN